MQPAATADALSSACVGCVKDAQIQTVAGSKVSGPIPAASLPTGSGNYVQNSNAQQANASFNIAGNGVIGGDLTVAGTLNANVGGNFIQNRTTPQTNTNFNISGNGTVGGTLLANNAGIGTASPLSKLHIVSGSSEMPPRLQSSGTTGFAAGWDFYRGATPKGYVGAPDSAAANGPGEMLLFGSIGTKTSLWAGGNRSVTLETNGNVGIGTASPTFAKLQVDGGSSSGVYANSTSGNGVYGNSTSGVGVYGKSTQFEGVRGEASDVNRGGVVGVHLGGGIGVFGTSSGAGVQGNSATGPGVVGGSTSGSGVYGESAASQTLASAGVYGRSTGNGGIGVTGEANVNNAVGVFGVSTSPNGYGVYGRNASGGAIYADGNTIQTRDKGGWVKAMALVNGDGTILRCYNSFLGGNAASTVPCGLLGRHDDVGLFLVDFGFKVNDRFVSVTIFDNSNSLSNLVAQIFDAPFLGANAVRVIVFDDGGDRADTAFVIFVL